MQTFKDYLIEGRDAPLYHSTDIESASIILKTDTLLDKTNHSKRWYRVDFPIVPEDHFKKQKTDEIRGVSLTRNFHTAVLWRNYKYDGFILEDRIIFQIDQPKLVQNYRINPINIFGAVGQNTYSKQEGLAEEFVQGPIKPLSKYLNCIIIGNGSFDRILRDGKTREDLIKKRVNCFLHIPLKHIETKEVNVFTSADSLYNYIIKNETAGRVKTYYGSDIIDNQHKLLHKSTGY